MNKLSGRQRRQLRALGHALEPVVQIGEDGLTDGVAKALDGALEAHELVKVKLGPSAPDDRRDAAGSLAKRTRSELVQVLGKVILLYRRPPGEQSEGSPSVRKSRVSRRPSRVGSTARSRSASFETGRGARRTGI